MNRAERRRKTRQLLEEVQYKKIEKHHNLDPNLSETERLILVVRLIKQGDVIVKKAPPEFVKAVNEIAEKEAADASKQ
ncbi:MAG: hypothetical protein KAR06_06515 [Deltaproteobacteria bacterium]|nr:hypothetical protein [Deltaproteobacteria bacterium]